eukprot:c15049_g1_i1 orf=366-1334(+)
MAHQASSPSLGSSSAQQQVLSSVPLNASQTPLDLNLSQKVSQNTFKGHDETEISHHQAFEAFKNPQLESVPKEAADIFGSNTNGCIDSSANCLSEHNTGEQERVQSHASPLRPDANPGAAATTAPNEPPQDSNTAVKDGPPVVNEPTTVSAGRKRKSPRVEAAANAQKEQLQSGKTVLEDCLPQGNELTPASPGQKRKSPRVKQQTPDGTKKVILALEANEDEGVVKPKVNPRGNSHLPKDTVMGTPRSRSKSSVAKSDAPDDLAERRLLLEERKLRLAEQRFALEEKKLEATIEIGKGLIVSMERMTNTISGLGIPSSRHR